MSTVYISGREKKQSTSSLKGENSHRSGTVFLKFNYSLFFSQNLLHTVQIHPQIPAAKPLFHHLRR